MYKPVVWMGRSKEIVSRFPKVTRRQAGHELFEVQKGFLPDDWKPMSSIGAGVIEIRLHRPHEHRVVYVSKFGEAVYVLHAFEKKTRKTAQREIEAARRAYQALLIQRRKERV